MSQVKAIPDGYHAVTPMLNVRDADGLLDFLKRVFGASVSGRHDRPDGKLMHAEVRLGDSMLMVSEANEQMGPQPGGLYVYVEDADATYRKALDAGATSIMEPADMFWGDRFASVRDASGNQWCIATHIEDVPQDELDRRAQAFNEQCGQQP